MPAAIQTNNLTKQFGKHTAVDQLNLSVQPGEVFGFLGPNGAGKTTTIGMLLGLVQPTAGRAELLGYDIARQPAQALRQVGALIETPAFYPYLSGRDNLRVLARAAGLASARVETVLALVELGQRGKDRFKHYSQGMKQRLGIAAALLHAPALLILDEPTNGLDPAGQHEIRSLIMTLAQGGQTIFLSSHVLHEIEQICGRVAILKQGRLVAQGTVAELLRRDGLLLRLAGDHQDAAYAAELLRKLAWVERVELQPATAGTPTLLVVAPANRAAELNALLVAANLPVAELRPQQARLEDLFLELTRSSL